MALRTDIEKQNISDKKYDEETKLGSSRGKMWSLYMKQAGGFNHKMIEDWKGMMEGTLIFAGLFSGVVTAFMIEALRKLVPVSVPNSPPLTNPGVSGSSPYYITISVLWSLSLAFSIGCAISATLVQQWARSYLHAVDNQHLPPHKRALIHAYMYEGMEKSHVTFAIEGIPILLHASLFLFLIGLIVYFHSIHPLIAYPIMACFILSVTMYLVPTCMPLARSNFPFHTPLSTPIWWVWRIVRHREPLRNAKTMEKIRERDATRNNRDNRGYHAISWILSQSDEDGEFEELLDAIAGFKGGSDLKGGRMLVACLVQAFPGETLLRTHGMLRSCGRFTRKMDNRAVVILRAIPALAISWSIIHWGNDDVHHLRQWPLETLETLDRVAVASNKAVFNSDLVISTYCILLQIATQHVGASEITLEDPNMDHELDNIKAARDFVLEMQGEKKSTTYRLFDIIVDVLVSISFRRQLEQALKSQGNLKPGDSVQSEDTRPLASYAKMLFFLCQEGDPQECLYESACHLLLGLSFSELHDNFCAVSPLMSNRTVIDFIIHKNDQRLFINPNNNVARKIKEILDEKLSVTPSVSPSPVSTRPSSHKEPPRLPLSEDNASSDPPIVHDITPVTRDSPNYSRNNYSAMASASLVTLTAQA